MTVIGCKQQDTNTHNADSIEERRSFKVTGVVQEVRRDGEVLVIDHEEIPGFMQQMIMPFKVSAEEPKRAYKPGEEIAFTYEVESVKSWIHSVEKTGQMKEVKLASFDDIPDPKDVKILSIGDEMPDYEFNDENGKPVKLSDYRGMPVGLTFVFTRCPLPEYCPAMMRNFDKAEEALKTDADAPKDWKLLSISFDSWTDTPETMKAYGKAYGQDSDNWSLLSTDSCCVIGDIGGSVGLKFADRGGSFVHNLRTVVLDKNGVITRIFTDETWEVSQLIDEMKKLGRANYDASVAKSGDSL